MDRIQWRYVVLFLSLALIQVFLLNAIRWGGYINPQLYLLFVLMLPVSVPSWLLLVSAFSMGLLVDVFSDSLAMHTSATLFMAFCRPAIIRVITGHVPDEGIRVPSFATFGGPKLGVYTLVMTLIHHVVLFFMEIFHFREMLHTLSRIALSTVLTFVFLILGFALLNRSFSR